MWAVINNTNYSAEGGWVQDKDANQIWLVVLKATFDILPNGSTRRAKKQVPVLRTPMYQGKFADSSLLYEADLRGNKVATDVLLNGNAWAPKGQEIDQVDVRIHVGRIDKRLRIFGDRKWEKGMSGEPSISDAKPFVSMPITYERAFGGWDKSSRDPSRHRLESRNPLGTGFSISKKNCHGLPLPNVEDPKQLIKSWRDHPSPVGFGAIDSAWSPRRELAGTYDEAWQETRMPLWAEDFDQRYNNCAPEDQQLDGFLRGGESVSLFNLCQAGHLAFRLPRIYPFFRTRIGTERLEHRAKLGTVIIEPEYPRVIMAWQTSLICNHRVDDLDATMVTLKAVRPGR